MAYKKGTLIILKNGKQTRISRVYDDVYELVNGGYAVESEVDKIDKEGNIVSLLKKLK
jgi:hypothetical protein